MFSKLRLSKISSARVCREGEFGNADFFRNMINEQGRNVSDKRAEYVLRNKHLHSEKYGDRLCADDAICIL